MKIAIVEIVGMLNKRWIIQMFALAVTQLVRWETRVPRIMTFVQPHSIVCIVLTKNPPKQFATISAYQIFKY